MSEENQRKWQYLIKFYQDCINDGHDLEPLLKVVKWLTESEYKNDIYPQKSIFLLSLSALEDSYNQENIPTISINYHDGSFQITYAPNSPRTDNLEKYKCHQPQVFSLLQSLFVRLKIEATIKQSPVSDCSGENTRMSKKD